MGRSQKMFHEVGQVSDVYVARRRDYNGRFFGFVRFSGIKNGKKMEDSLKGIEYGGNQLKVNICRFERCNVDSMNRIERPRRNQAHDRRSNTKMNGNEWLKHGEKQDLRYERLAWLKILGLPLRLWDEENFSRIVRNFGRVINPFENMKIRKDLSMGKVGILTSRRQWINEEITVMAGGEAFRIGVVEYTDDWSPFKQCLYDKVVESDQEDEDQDGDGEDELDEDCDGVSDTWRPDMQGDDVLEDGEFKPDDYMNEDGASVKEAGIVEEDGVNASGSGCRGRRLEGGK
ncbi:hypothetical protein L1887_29056 [Cichorium endivia]|nr:hypothetical protein L1887_29056 [Cichorium endivia]